MSEWRQYFKLKFFDSLWALQPKPQRNDYSIGIVTYLSRFEAYFKPNLERLCRAFPDIQIYVAVNGFHDQARQEQYLAEILSYCSNFPNVKVLTYLENQSLSKLWNQLILCAHPKGILLLNDDIVILPFFRRQLENQQIFSSPMATINNSWSHFWITPGIARQVGWFDERFPGIGEEDGDYSARLALAGVPLKNFKSNMLIHFNHQPSEVSWGKDLSTHCGKYTNENRLFIMKKYSFSQEPAHGYEWVQICRQYMKCNDGMETPDFYPHIASASEKVRNTLR